ncbi:MAG: tetratricopeptide repeat protein [Bacteroidales bacterium]|nr:tetratricopeptide repeat protein [Bacteroidales bacterium]
MKLRVLLTLLPFITGTLIAQSGNSELRKGNKAYSRSDFAAAELLYRKAADKNPEDQRAIFNLGTSLYRQDNFDDAATHFSGGAATLESMEDRSYAYHNLGNAMVKTGKLKEAVEAYKNALRVNPHNEDARFNLAWVQRQMRREQEQQQEQEQEQEQQQEQQQQQQQQEQKQEQQSRKPQQINKEDAERMLQALKNEEQRTLDKVQQKKVPAERRKTDKDW